MGAQFELSGKVVIKAANIGEVERIFEARFPIDAAYAEQNGRRYPETPIIELYFECLGVGVEWDDNRDDIVYLGYWNDVSDTEQEFWAEIAPFVEDGSYLTVTERDWDVHEIYRFEDGKLVVREGVLVYHLPKERQRAADIAEGVGAALQELQSPHVDYGQVGLLLEEARLLALALKQSLEDAELGVEVEE